MNFKDWNDIVNWLINSGFLLTAVIFLWHQIKPWLDAKKLHAKTQQERELLWLVENLADTAVASLAGNKTASGSEKFQEATRYVANTLADQGHAVSRSTIDHAVQSAYEKSDLTPTVKPDNKPKERLGLSVNESTDVMQAIATAFNRANEVGGE